MNEIVIPETVELLGKIVKFPGTEISKVSYPTIKFKNGANCNVETGVVNNVPGSTITISVDEQDSLEK